MDKRRVTILIPTFDHAETLNYSLQSVLNQTHQNFEIFVVGDGVPEKTRKVMKKWCNVDSRIRFFDNPKGEHQGELHRREALKEATGEIIAYLADDDLWFPEHLETILHYYPKYNFISTLSINVSPDGTFAIHIGMLQNKVYRKRLMTSPYSFGTTFGSHSKDVYKSVDNPWEIAPVGVNTDLSFWRTLLKNPACRPYSLIRPTAIRLGADLRKNMSTEKKLKELAYWLSFISDPTSKNLFINEILVKLITPVINGETEVDILRKENAELHSIIESIKHSKWWKIKSIIEKIKP